MSKVKADGQLRHRFWAEYSAFIVLVFADEESARDALKTLGGKWVIGEKTKKALGWIGNSEELNAVKKQLGGYGADEKKIDSLQFSVDYGERFSCEIPVSPSEQMSLL